MTCESKCNYRSHFVLKPGWLQPGAAWKQLRATTTVRCYRYSTSCSSTYSSPYGNAIYDTNAKTTPVKSTTFQYNTSVHHSTHRPTAPHRQATELQVDTDFVYYNAAFETTAKATTICRRAATCKAAYVHLRKCLSTQEWQHTIASPCRLKKLPCVFRHFHPHQPLPNWSSQPTIIAKTAPHSTLSDHWVD